ncbi:MAG: hypothetical protein AB8B73_16285 [Ekhidna sp.]
MEKCIFAKQFIIKYKNIMYKRHILHSLILGLFLFSCAVQKEKSELGILKGLIGIYEGNCMPSPGAAPCKPTPLKTTIFITEPSKNFEMALLIDSIETNSKGEFQMKLIPKEYSLFIKDGDDIICNGYKCKKECYCTPFLIVTDSITNVSANINKASW